MCHPFIFFSELTGLRVLMSVRGCSHGDCQYDGDSAYCADPVRPARLSNRRG